MFFLLELIVKNLFQIPVVYCFAFCLEVTEVIVCWCRIFALDSKNLFVIFRAAFCEWNNNKLVS